MLALHLKLVGAWLLLLAAAHPYIATRLRWREEMAKVSPLTRQVFFVHGFFIALLLVLMGALLLFGTRLLLEPSPLAAAVLGGLCFFWLVRLVFQIAVYDASHWRGNRLNTAIHVFFSAMWAYSAAVLGIAAAAAVPN